MDPDQERLLKETYRLALENNKILRGMRRQVWISRIMTILIYAIFLIAPIWFYMTYLKGTMDGLLETYGAMQTKGQEAAGQYDRFKEMLQQLQSE